MHRGHDRSYGIMQARFHLSGTVCTSNCRIWDTENPRTFLEIPLHSAKVAFWCGFMATFIIGLFFFKENTRNVPVTGTIKTKMNRNMLENFVIYLIQQCQYAKSANSTTCMQDAAPLHIGLCDEMIS